MATLHKFKLLATQCAIAGSPARSPTTSPVIHLRRRKTLRMLLSRNNSRRLSRRDDSSDRQGLVDDLSESQNNKKKEQLGVSHKLKDLFISSPPLEDTGEVPKKDGDVKEAFLPETESAGGNSGLPWRRGGAASLRPLSASFRHRLLRRAWRPVLVTIPE